MITIINISGMNCMIMLLEVPPSPNGRPCANAGIINMAPPGGNFAARQPFRRMADLAREIGADYSHRWPNCNAARRLGGACRSSPAPLREGANRGKYGPV